MEQTIKELESAIKKISKWEESANYEANNSIGRKDREAYFSGEANAFTRVVNYLQGKVYRTKKRKKLKR